MLTQPIVPNFVPTSLHHDSHYMKPITIQEIAERLGVSKSTVSRALKDHPDISQKTKDAVNKLAKELDYQPNTLALNLRQQRSKTIGIIVPELVHYFFSTVISGVEDIAHKAGYNVIITQSNEQHEREVFNAQALYASRVDGLLVSLASNTDDVDHLRNLYQKEMPIVFYDRASEDLNVSKVLIDDFKGGFLATEHLILQGCRRIAHLFGPPNLMISQQRSAGYKAALQKYQLPIDEQLIIPCEGATIEGGFFPTQSLLQRSTERPDGIFASNDITAIGAMKALKNAHVRIPHDIALIGFSDWQLSAFTEPALSSISQSGFQIGQRAAELLLDEIQAPEGQRPAPRTEILAPSLVVRASSQRI